MPATKEKSGGPAQPFAISVVPALRRYPVGALTGIVLTGILTLLTDAVPAKPWLELPIALICVPGCMLIERLLDWRYSGKVDARMRHSAAHEDAKIALEKLLEYEKDGRINKPDAHKLAATIAKRDVAGGPRHAKARGGYRKRAEKGAPPTVVGGSEPSDASGLNHPERPAA